jgi:hypothetical protein
MRNYINSVANVVGVAKAVKNASKPKRASYRQGVAWIALNDDPGSIEKYQLDTLSGLISVLLLADLFGKDSEAVARDVIAYRKKHADEKENQEVCHCGHMGHHRYTNDCVPF